MIKITFSKFRLRNFVTFASLFLIALFFLPFFPYLVSAFYNNLGSIGLSKSVMPDAQSPQLQIPNAERHYWQSLSWRLRNAGANRNLGRLYAIQGDYSAAEQVLLRTLALNPDDALARFALGDVYDALGKKQEAIEEWKKVRAIPRLLKVGNELMERKLWDESLEAFEEAARLEIRESGRFAAYRGIAEVFYTGKHDLDQAAYYFQRAIDARPQEISLYLALIKMYSKEGRYEQALDWAHRAQVAFPNSEEPLLWLGHIYNNQGSVQKAIKSYSEAIALNPKNEDSYIALGNLYKDQGEYNLATAWLDQAVHVSPANPRAHFYLGRVQFDLARYPEAIEHLRTSIGLDPEEPSAHYWLGRSLFAVGLIDQAIEAYSTAVKFAPENWWIHYHLAIAFEEIDRLAEAETEYETVLELNPDHNLSKQRLDELRR